MIQHKINGNSAVFFQVLILLFFIPFLLFTSYIIIGKNWSIEGGGFLSILIIAGILVIRNALSYGDIYISGNKVIIKKVTGVQTILKSEIKLIDDAFLPFIYYIEFDNKKVYFQSKPKEILNRVIGDSQTILEQIREKFKE